MTKLFTLLLVLLAGCASGPEMQHPPMSARPTVQAARVPAMAGAVASPDQMRLALFEDRRARGVGDILTVVIQERTDAAKASKTIADRSSETDISLPALKPGALKKAGIRGLDALTDFTPTVDQKFEGKGDSNANNKFTGTITVTVVELLENGNLLISGEKQIGINQGMEVIRLSGVVNPAQVTAQNSVLSTQIADARIEYRGQGVLDDAQRVGWLTRLFMSWSPF